MLGDGYTAADMPKFRAHLDKHLNILWSIEPFRSYRNYFNVYAVEIVSRTRVAAITLRPGESRAAAQRRRFGCSSAAAARTSTRAASPSRRTAQAIVREYAARATPNPDQILVIANSDTYGGIGGRLATTTGGNSLSPLITPHEIGHSLGGLTDEYTYSARGKAGGTYTGGEPEPIHMTLLTEDECRRSRRSGGAGSASRASRAA